MGFWVACISMAYTQQIEISGDIRESGTNQVLVQVSIRSVQGGAMTNSDERGRFTLPLNPLIQDTLVLEMTSFEPLRIPIGPYNENADLGSIYMVRDREVSQIFNLIELDNESFDENPENDMNMGLLRSTRDLLSRRAAFDLGQAFFRLRGYDAANGVLLINGMPMNRMLRGQPQWNNWGGLNDVFREQETSIGLEASPWHFGGLLGTTYIDSRPGTHRNGLRITTSLSNKTYMARIDRKSTL